MKKKQKEMTRLEYRAYQKEWRLAHPENVKQHYKTHYAKAKSEGRVLCKYSHDFYIKNKENYKAAHDKWVKKNKELIRAYGKMMYLKYLNNPFREDELLEATIKWKKLREEADILKNTRQTSPEGPGDLQN